MSGYWVEVFSEDGFLRENEWFEDEDDAYDWGYSMCESLGDLVVVNPRDKEQL